MKAIRMKAWCGDDGLIKFGSHIPTDAYPISDGGPVEMAIVRRLAHKDGCSYWVPGVRDNRDWQDRINAFSEACIEHMDDDIPRYSPSDWTALQQRVQRRKGETSSI